MQYQQELKTIERRCNELLKQINDEDSMRDSLRVRPKQILLEKQLAECMKGKKQLLYKIKQHEEYHNILHNKIACMISNYLTIERLDTNGQPFTNNQIVDFIKENNDKIENAIENIITHYDEEGKIELLKEPIIDCIDEYLYQIVKTL